VAAARLKAVVASEHDELRGAAPLAQHLTWCHSSTNGALGSAAEVLSQASVLPA